MWTVFVFIKSDFEVQVDDRSAICQRAVSAPMEVQSTVASIPRQVVHDSAGSLRSRSHLVSQADTSALDQDGFGEITPVIVTASCAHMLFSRARKLEVVSRASISLSESPSSSAAFARWGTARAAATLR